jgi:hypothetical protein
MEVKDEDKVIRLFPSKEREEVVAYCPGSDDPIPLESPEEVTEALRDIWALVNAWIEDGQVSTLSIAITDEDGNIRTAWARTGSLADLIAASQLLSYRLVAYANGQVMEKDE